MPEGESRRRVAEDDDMSDTSPESIPVLEQIRSVVREAVARGEMLPGAHVEITVTPFGARLDYWARPR